MESPGVTLWGRREAHIDVLLNLFIVLALLGFQNSKKKTKLSFLFLGCAVAIKYFAIILLPFIVTRKNLRHIWALLSSFFNISSFVGSSDYFQFTELWH